MLFIHWLVSAIAIAVAAYLVPGVTVTTIGVIIAVVVLGILNIFIRPILLILSLPINIVNLVYLRLLSTRSL